MVIPTCKQLFKYGGSNHECPIKNYCRTYLVDFDHVKIEKGLPVICPIIYGERDGYTIIQLVQGALKADLDNPQEIKTCFPEAYAKLVEWYSI